VLPHTLYHYTLSFILCFTVSPKCLFAQSETHCAPETQTTQQTTRAPKAKLHSKLLGRTSRVQSGERSAETLPKRNYTANYTRRISSAETLPKRNYTANYTMRISCVQSGERSAETLPKRNFTANYTRRNSHVCPLPLRGRGLKHHPIDDVRVNRIQDDRLRDNVDFRGAQIDVRFALARLGVEVDVESHLSAIREEELVAGPVGAVENLHIARHKALKRRVILAKESAGMGQTIIST
jgi:hypothetical protein